MKKRGMRKYVLAAAAVLMLVCFWFAALANQAKIIPVPALCQYPGLPTGCESTAAAMALQYWGIPVTPEQFASDWLECENFYLSGNQLYGPDPGKAFAGDPFLAYSYGCYADPIVHAVNSHSSTCMAEKITGRTLEELCTAYIDADEPLLIWATMHMKQPRKGNSWKLADETLFTWIAGEHCLVLVGYNEKEYFLNDPQTGTTVSYRKTLVEQRFKDLGSQAVHICKKEAS